MGSETHGPSCRGGPCLVRCHHRLDHVAPGATPIIHDWWGLDTVAAVFIASITCWIPATAVVLITSLSWGRFPGLMTSAAVPAVAGVIFGTLATTPVRAMRIAQATDRTEALAAEVIADYPTRSAKRFSRLAGNHHRSETAMSIGQQMTPQLWWVFTIPSFVPTTGPCPTADRPSDASQRFRVSA